MRFKEWINRLVVFVRIFLKSLGKGDELLSTSNKNTDDAKIGIETQNEINSVYNDLVKKNITEEVKELRHEMYFSERKSHKYTVDASGNSAIRTAFGYSGNIENSDGNEVWIVQENFIDTMDFNSALKKYLNDDIRRDFTLEIERDFIPTFRVEEFTNKIVLKKSADDNVIVDLYTTQYPKQFLIRHRPFIAEMNRIYEGDRRSTVIDFDKLSFMSFKAYGTDDFIVYKFKDFKLIDMLKYDGNFVLRYTAKSDGEPEDLLLQYFNESAQKKSDNKELRKNGAFSFEIAQTN